MSKPVNEAKCSQDDGRQLRPALEGIGKYQSGRSDVSEKAEEILRRAFRKNRHARR
jgi:hypothetical protein